MDDPETEVSPEEKPTSAKDHLERNQEEPREEVKVDNEAAEAPGTKKEEDEAWEIIPKDSVYIAKEKKLDRMKKKFKGDTERLKEEINRKDDIIKEKGNELEKLEKKLENEKVQQAEKLESLEAKYLEKEKENEHNKQLIIHYESEMGKLKCLENEIEKLKPLKSEKRRYKKEVSELKQQLDKAKEEEMNLQSNLNKMKNENKDLHGRIQTASQHNKNLEEDKQDLLLRLSKLAGAKLTVDNPNIADLSDEKRPTKLAEEFAELYDNEWTDAFENINTENEQAKTELMLKILQDANEVCIMMSCQHMARIKESMCTLNMSTVTRNQASSSTQMTTTSQSLLDCDTEPDIIEVDFQSLPSDQIKTVTELKRSMADRLFNQFQMKATDWIARVNSIDKEKQEVVIMYIKKCVDICWSMSQHVPPVFINFDGVPCGSWHFNNDMYKPYTKTGKYMDFVVWPAVYLYEGGPLLSKGVAQGRH